MTTVDFWANPVGHDGPSISLSNGLGGPATGALFRLYDMVKAGEVEGTSQLGAASATLTGAALKQVVGEALDPSVADQILDDALYSASAVEV